jgi:hypothetical protein
MRADPRTISADRLRRRAFGTFRNAQTASGRLFEGRDTEMNRSSQNFRQEFGFSCGVASRLEKPKRLRCSACALTGGCEDRIRHLLLLATNRFATRRRRLLDALLGAPGNKLGGFPRSIRENAKLDPDIPKNIGRI